MAPRTWARRAALVAVVIATGGFWSGTAVAYVRPSRLLSEVEVSSVKKKMKDKAFARAVRREDITEGAALLDGSLDEHIATVLAALQEIAPTLGL